MTRSVMNKALIPVVTSLAIVFLCALPVPGCTVEANLKLGPGFAAPEDHAHEDDPAWNDPLTPWNETAVLYGFDDPTTIYDESQGEAFPDKDHDHEDADAEDGSYFSLPTPPSKEDPPIHWVWYGLSVLLLVGAAALARQAGLPPFRPRNGRPTNTST